MRLYVVAFGKLKAAGLRDTGDHYLKMIKPWVPTEEVELKPLSVPDKSPDTRARIQAQEAEILMAKLTQLGADRGGFYLLDETGKASPTQQWAAMASDLESSGISTAAFCIGSSLGFSPELKKRAPGAPESGASDPAARARPGRFVRTTLPGIEGINSRHPYHNEG